MWTGEQHLKKSKKTKGSNAEDAESRAAAPRCYRSGGRISHERHNHDDRNPVSDVRGSRGLPAHDQARNLCAREARATQADARQRQAALHARGAGRLPEKATAISVVPPPRWGHFFVKCRCSGMAHMRTI